MNNTKHDDPILEVDIFDILGLDLSEVEIEQQTEDMEELAWLDFLEKDLPELVGEEELKALEVRLNDESLDFDQSVDIVVKAIEAKGHNFDDVLTKRSVQLKKDLVWDQIVSIENDIKELENSEERSEKESLIAKLKEQFEAQEWMAMGESFKKLYAE